MHSYNLSNMLGIILQNQKKLRSNCYYPCSSFLKKNLEILMNLNYINGFSVVAINKKLFFKIFLKYKTDGKPVIDSLRFYSSPGRKLFLNSYKFQALFYRYKNSIFIFSTSIGLQARSFFWNSDSIRLGGLLLYRVN